MRWTLRSPDDQFRLMMLAWTGLAVVFACFLPYAMWYAAPREFGFYLVAILLTLFRASLYFVRLLATSFRSSDPAA